MNPVKLISELKDVGRELKGLKEKFKNLTEKRKEMESQSQQHIALLEGQLEEALKTMKR